MTRSSIQTVLETTYPPELVDLFLTSYEHALAEYKKGHWQYFGNEIGQFIEVARRIVEYTLDSKYTPLTEKLSIFTEKVLAALENHNTAISEVYRIVIPRTLYAMYCLRNKRGMIHKSYIDPNKMDATVLIGNAKWVLAEFFRLASSLSFEETADVVDSIMCRETWLIWDTGSALRILNNKMSTKQKIVCLLYIQDRQADSSLQASIEYKNTTEFKRILRTMHKDRWIEYSNNTCLLSPIGIEVAENLLAE